VCVCVCAKKVPPVSVVELTIEHRLKVGIEK
jgi:hypothetical protein